MHKVLVIEDEHQSRTIFLECLQEEGFQAIGAENGIEGIQKAQIHRPDLIVCDVMMPELDGYEVLANLRQHAHTSLIPFIFLSARATRTEVREGMNLGADDYLTKPCTAEDFLSAITTRLQKRQQLEQQLLSQPAQSFPTQSGPSLNLKQSTQAFWDIPDCPQFKQVFEFIEAHYHAPIGLKEIAASVNYSPAYLTTMIRRQTGQTLYYWLVRRRMMAACDLLLNTADSNSQVAEKVGYSDVSSFIRQFRQVYNTTPQAWRNQPRPID